LNIKNRIMTKNQIFRILWKISYSHHRTPKFGFFLLRVWYNLILAVITQQTMI
jgi:hypothetical protein